MGARQIVSAIKKYSKFLIASHIDLEGDALGSELALASLLRKLGKSAFIVNASSIPENYQFLPGIKKIYSFSAQLPRAYQKLNSMDFEAVIVIDCSNRQRIGHLANLLDGDLPTINIDHHPGNTNFGLTNWVNPRASSAGEMIYYLFKTAKKKLDKEDALNIYTAMLTDTGSFRHTNTQSATFKISAELLKSGIKPAEVYARVYENNSARDLIILAKIVAGIKFGANNKIAWTKIEQAEFKKIRYKPDLLDRALDFAKSVKSVKIVVLFCQMNKRLVKLSLRCKSPVDVQKIAKSYGGGGHKLASGCIIKGNLKQVEKKVLTRIKKFLL